MENKQINEYLKTKNQMVLVYVMQHYFDPFGSHYYYNLNTHKYFKVFEDTNDIYTFETDDDFIDNLLYWVDCAKGNEDTIAYLDTQINKAIDEIVTRRPYGWDKTTLSQRM